MTHEEEAASADNFVSRQIVAEIMNYGITQIQILKIIEFLAMELENRDSLLSLVEISQSLQNKDNHKNIIITET